MVTYRIDRINKEFLRAISEILQVRIKKDTVRDAILTKVSTSKDLSFAKVFKFKNIRHYLPPLPFRLGGRQELRQIRPVSFCARINWLKLPALFR